MPSMSHTRSAVSLARDTEPVVFAGVDTHKRTHHAAVVDHLGRPVGDRQFPTTMTGYQDLTSWIQSCGTVGAVGVEGTGSYGAGLNQVLHQAGLTVLEIDRPHRRDRYRHGKSDIVDAYSAATAACTGRAASTPKTRDGDVEAIRLLHRTRRSAVKARSDAVTTLRAMIVTCPHALRAQLAPLTRTALVTTCAGLRPAPVTDGGVLAAAKTALRSLARRITDLGTEIDALDIDLKALTERAAPELLALPGVGPETTAQLLITAGDNHDRFVSEAAFAHHCGVAPVPASSGKTHRHRLHRGGDRQANRALHIIALQRLKHDDRTRDYMARRTAEGKTKREIIRCLKRAIAREIFRILNQRTKP